MSNIFKTNSRSYDEFKRDTKNNFIENRYNRRQNDNEVRKRREKQEIEYNNNNKFKELQEKKIINVISINDFPELISINNNKISCNQCNQINFLDVIKKVETKCNKEEIINKTKLNKEAFLLKSDALNKEKEIKNEVLKKLVELYEKRTKKYIELWGYDEWEKMFNFPNYDYEYFDKLDEKYTQEMEEIVLEVIDSDEELN
jgi:hypothetical protein